MRQGVEAVLVSNRKHDALCASAHHPRESSRAREPDGLDLARAGVNSEVLLVAELPVIASLGPLSSQLADLRLGYHRSQR